MSFSAEKKVVRNELKAGVHLVAIHSMKKYIDSNKNAVIKNGEVAVMVTFCTGMNPNQYHDQIYWIGKGKEGLEKYFTRMCIDAGIDMSKTPLTEKDARNKRLWIAIRQVYTLINNGEEILKSDITGEPVTEHFVFQTAPIHDIERPPTWKGDPAKNGGEAMDEFVGYKEATESGYDTIKQETVQVASGPVLEMAQVTPEMEKNLSDDQIEQELNKVAETSLQAAPNFGTEVPAQPSPVVPVAALVQATTMPNFDAPVVQPAPVQQPAATTTPMPNFGDTPDAKF